ncbi:SMI1/KNR4 family protein [Pyxidicoccus fallax]|uniref:SMI1/KNR4 family protein n=1 Tax=Pyxidicoccus fallax TaxID=394095 RepID=A0A848LMK2_9BACT|nr:SMI1/KNR4 family protein [Pyxidicoccus fallax]NMO18966.1 SMI1/KNR4 family protein [Pyxidicoccus fallax]NPC79465.1 SMI1/KNR4 family protein [Pyxidicoccus fallax]
MGQKNKPSALGGLAAALQKAGLATKEQVEQTEAEKRERDLKAYRASLGLTEPAAKSAASYREQVDAINAWFAEQLRRAPDLMARLTGERALALAIQGTPATPEAVRAVELALGFPLPPSFAAFLLEVGSVAFLGPWSDATTRVEDLAAASASLEADVTLTAERFARAAEGAGVTLDLNAPRRLLHVSEDRGGEPVFALCARRDASGEAPVFMRFHDEPDALYDPSADFRQWFSARLARFQEELQQWLARGAPL